MGTRIIYCATVEDKKTLKEIKNDQTDETIKKHLEKLIPKQHTGFNLD